MLPKHKYLLTYRYAEVIQDLNMEFCDRFISKFSRTHDQMVQAGRSGKQNIVEGVSQGRVSKKGEIKLLGVAMASIEELINDFEDFLRQKKLEIWPKDYPQIAIYRKWGIEATRLTSPKILTLRNPPIEAANLLLTLCHQLTFLLSRQIAAAEKKFIEEGGFTENLFRKRLSHRSPK